MKQFLIKLKSFKKLSPTKCKVLVNDDTDELCISSKCRIQGILLQTVYFYKTKCIVLNVKKKYYMLEEHLINELGINIKDLIEELGGKID